MRFFSIVWLVSAVFVACGECASDKQNKFPAQRSLRAYDIVVKNGEERAGFGNAINSISTGTSKLIDFAKLKVFLLLKKSGVDVLNKLRFGDDAAAALETPKLDALNKYIAMFNKENPDKKISLIGTLTARYGDDAMAKALVSAEKKVDSAPQVAELAKRLRAEQLSAWLDGGKSVDDVFNLLKLHTDQYNALISRKLEVLDDYIVKFNSEKNGHETLLETLTTGVGGEHNLKKLLKAAKRDPRAAPMAVELENFRQWQQQKMEPANVVKLLNLGGNVGNAVKSRTLRRFDEYIIEFNKVNLNRQETLIGVLTSKYGEAEVAKALVSAVKDKDMFVMRLQKQQLEGWLHSEKSVYDVYMLLKFKDDATAVVTRNVETLDNYIKLYNKAKLAEETLVGVFVKAFGETRLGNLLKRVPDSDKNSEKLRAQFKQLNREKSD
ncbi:hypothetical protein PI126_g16788 [Phytophthora idaei]|nr:hypothetical protein PI126_g16788 [Phytophthora idaei]